MYYYSPVTAEHTQNNRLSPPENIQPVFAKKHPVEKRFNNIRTNQQKQPDLFNLHNHFHFHAGACRNLRHAKRRAGMLSFRPKHIRQ